MGNLHDYIAENGGVSFRDSPLCDIDLLIFSRVAYVPLECTLTGELRPQKTLTKAAQDVLDCAKRHDLAYPYNLKEDGVMLMELRGAPRFAECMVGGFEDIIDLDKQEQFSALTFYLPDGSIAIAIRGTDTTLVGWKENLDLAISSAVPAQLDAVRYINAVAAITDGDIYVGGHSKGGNLAVYGAAFCTREAQKRIKMVRSYDGPGFQKEIAASPEFDAIAEVSRTILPVSSIVGMLLEHAEDFAVIDSSSAGILQHIPYHWHIENGDFVYVEERTNSSRFVDATMTQWIDTMTPLQRERMVEGLYYLATSGDGKNIRDLIKARKLPALVRAMKNMDDETRKIMEQTFKILLHSAKDSFFEMLERAVPEKPVNAIKRLESAVRMRTDRQ